jgi:hypothetical protein
MLSNSRRNAIEEGLADGVLDDSTKSSYRSKVHNLAYMLKNNGHEEMVKVNDIDPSISKKQNRKEYLMPDCSKLDAVLIGIIFDVLAVDPHYARKVVAKTKKRRLESEEEFQLRVHEDEEERLLISSNGFAYKSRRAIA